MGTHPSGPSTVANAGEKQLLSDWIATDSALHLSTRIASTFGDRSLPYLFKILSVQTALSIQAHPDKPLAQKLHCDRPELYKDDNHKPEMCIALTTFEGLCGFKPMPQIAAEIKRYKAQLVPGILSEDLFEAIQAPTTDKTVIATHLRALLAAYMAATPDALSQAIGSLVDAAGKTASKAQGSIEELAIRLQSQYPNDVGVLAPFLLNYIRLQPGEAFFMMANEPHAYLAGGLSFHLLLF